MPKKFFSMGSSSSKTSKNQMKSSANEDVAPEQSANVVVPVPDDKPSNLTYRVGDLLDAQEEFIVHQCNCVSIYAAGLAQAIAVRLPYADPYIDRIPDPANPTRCALEHASTPGSIRVWRSNSPDTPHVIGLYAQFEGGGPRELNDSKFNRLAWFNICLTKIAKIRPEVPKSLAFPHLIGCGIGGGDWTSYERLIVQFAESNPGIQVAIYQLPETVSEGKPKEKKRRLRK
jgi:O-acetyl-ADP-ribose deacetylase (regulator of RNase III)